MPHQFTSKEFEPLFDLGLTKNQALIYLNLLKYGIQSILELSKSTGVNRQQIYDDTEKLLEFGLIEATRKRRKKFLAASPTKLIKIGKSNVDKAQQVLERISANLSTLENIPRSKKSKINLNYFEGMEKIKNAYDKELEYAKNTEVLSFVGSVDDLYKFFPESYWKKWNRVFVNNKSTSRMLAHHSSIARESSKLDKEYSRETRFLEKFPLKVNIDVFNNVVLIVSFYDGLAVWIESDVLADSYRIMFESFWNLAE
ncbi:MAG: helix-turn-helix domain-containing protein [Patescibacteria group bacterium]